MSWLFSQALVAASSGDTSWDGEPCAPSNLMPTPRPFSCSDKTTEFCPPSPFGVTLRLLTASRGEAVLMSYLAAFPARTSPQPVVEPESTASNPASGFTWPESFVKYDPASRSWRTRQCSLLGGLAEFSETWPRWGSMRAGECSALETPARPTSANASGSWPTPKASAAGPDFAKLTRSKTGISLQTAVALYPTPRSTDGDRGGRGDLLQMVRGNSNSHFKAPTLTKDGLYTTPCADDTGHRKAKYAQGGTALSAQIGGALNPDWVEWLMGWPIGWTDCAAWGTDKFQPWLRSHGAC